MALVFAVDASERVGQAYWGGYGVAQHGLRGLIGSLHDELGRSPVRVSGLYPGPLRTALRARAYSVDQDPAAQGPKRPPLRPSPCCPGRPCLAGTILDASEAVPCE
jgi:NAD(P)-dependent dehydrogenase (short-subunit alcohol dehydrogenase family)